MMEESSAPRTTMKDVRAAKKRIIGAAYRGASSSRIAVLVDAYTEVLSRYVRDTVQDSPAANLLMAISENRK